MYISLEGGQPEVGWYRSVGSPLCSAIETHALQALVEGMNRWRLGKYILGLRSTRGEAIGIGVS